MLVVAVVVGLAARENPTRAIQPLRTRTTYSVDFEDIGVCFVSSEFVPRAVKAEDKLLCASGSLHARIAVLIGSCTGRNRFSGFCRFSGTSVGS